jgi:hypothetical protein
MYLGVTLFVLGYADLRHEFILLETSVLLLIGEPRARALAASGLLFAVLSLIKFTFALYAVPAIVLVCAWKWRESGRANVLVMPATYAIGFLTLWLILGQSLFNLPEYLSLYLEMASGYVEAMSIPGPKNTFLLGMAILAIDVIVCLALIPFAQRKGRYLVCLLLIFAMLHLQFRHGFIRHDAHCLGFFFFGVALPFVVLAAETQSQKLWGVRLGLMASVCLSLIGFEVCCIQGGPGLTLIGPYIWVQDFRTKWQWMRHPNGHRKLMEQLRMERAQQFNLPQTRAIVGNDRIDMTGYEQGVLLLNGFNYAPRPVFQSYAAYTPKLLELNAAHYRGDRAPKFTLMKMLPMDGRVPASEDGGVMLELFKNYHPVLKEKGYLLLERCDADCDVEISPLDCVEQEIIMGHEAPIDLKPGLYQTISFQFRLRNIGKLLHSLYRNPILIINFRLSNGETRSYRLVPGIAAHEFLLNPLVEDDNDFVEIYAGNVDKRVVSFSIHQEEFRGSHPYRFEVQMSLKTYPREFFRSVKPSEIHRLRCEALGAIPERVTGDLKLARCDGLDSLVVENGNLSYAMKSGARRITGQYGVVSAATNPSATKGQPNHADGVEFAIESISATGQRTVLWRNRLTPSRRPEDRGPHTFIVELPSDNFGGALELHTTDQTSHDPVSDRGYWSQIRFE